MKGHSNLEQNSPTGWWMETTLEACQKQVEPGRVSLADKLYSVGEERGSAMIANHCPMIYGDQVYRVLLPPPSSGLALAAECPLILASYISLRLIPGPARGSPNKHQCQPFFTIRDGVCELRRPCRGTPSPPASIDRQS